MNPDTITRLRAESLAATLSAARDRRVRQRTGAFALTVIAIGVIIFSVLPRRTPEPGFIARSQPAAIPALPQTVNVVHTESGALARITTQETATLVRVSTVPANRVERIDNAGLAGCFPDKGIAVIQVAGEAAKVVFF